MVSVETIGSIFLKVFKLVRQTYRYVIVISFSLSLSHTLVPQHFKFSFHPSRLKEYKKNKQNGANCYPFRFLNCVLHFPKNHYKCIFYIVIKKMRKFVVKTKENKQHDTKRNAPKRNGFIQIRFISCVAIAI